MISPLLTSLVAIVVAIGVLAPTRSVAHVQGGCDFGCNYAVFGADDPAVKHIEYYTLQNGHCIAAAKQPCHEDIPCKMELGFGIVAPNGLKFRIFDKGTTYLAEDGIFRFKTDGCGTYHGADGDTLAISLAGRPVTIGCYCARCVGFGH